MIYTIIGVIILILALILLLILFIPFHISFYLNKKEKDIRGNFQVRWLKIRLLKSKIPPEKKEKEKKKKEPEKKPEKKRKLNIDVVPKVLNKFQAAFKHLIPILCAFIKSIKFENLYLNLNLGFISPVNTALFSGYFWSVSSIINIIPSINLSITPDFQKTRYDGSLDFELNLTLYRIVWALLKALTKKPVRELIWCIRKLNQDQKEKEN